MRLSVVIPTLNRQDLLGDTLASIAACDPAPDEVLVVDASPEGTSAAVVQEAAQRHPAIDFSHVTGTRGACRQRNRGIELASGELIAFLDDDVRLAPDAFGRAAALLEQPDVAGVSGKILEPSPRRISLKHSPLRRYLLGAGRQGTFTAYGYPNRLWSLDERHDVEVFQGCFMVAGARDAREVGFDERLESANGYASLDDEDFSLRLSRRGRLVYDPEIVIEHRNTGFATSRARQFNRDLVRNRAYTFRKSFPQTRAARAQWWLNMAIHIVHRVINRDWGGVRGLVDGLAEVARGRRTA